jgi:hypothetical protein
MALIADLAPGNVLVLFLRDARVLSELGQARMEN